MSILHKLIWLVVLFMLVHGLPHSQNSADLESNDVLEVTNNLNYRLSTDVSPLHYIMKFVPNFNVFSYDGKSFINIVVSVENKTTITLHAVNLTFDEEYTNLVAANNRTIKPVIHLINNVTQFLTLVFETPIATGSYWLNLKYTGRLNDYGYGFYRRFYVNEMGEKVWLAVTNLEPTYARHIFPCFDEPAMKATFKISIKHHDKYTAISNMPVMNKIKDNVETDKIWTNFHVTPVMSTYLIALVVADLKNISNKDGNFTFWARENKIQNCRYALDVGPKILKVLEDYTGIQHIIPKMDNIVIPSHTSMAMENWGAVIYNEEVFYDESNATTAMKEHLTAVLSHEFSHQWFGNLVTPAWWDQVWLSEGFSNYFQHFITDKVEPKWRMMDKMVVEYLQPLAFRVNEEERPLNSKVNTPAEIKKKFGSVTYYMGGCILRMTSHVLTENVFQTGVRQFLKKNEFGAATTDDLFNALIANAKNIPNDISLKRYFNSWINQAGFPVVNVNRTSAIPGHISINQTRYISNISDISKTTESWWIPLNFATQSNPNFNDTQPTHWLKPNRLAQEVPLELNDNQWFIVNKQQTGLYRVNYDEQNWNLIADYLNTPNYTNIHVLNRAQLLDDSFNLVLDNYLDDWNIFLNISRYLAQEDDYFAWYSAFEAFERFQNHLLNPEVHKLFNLYILKLIQKVENRVGYSETSEDDHLTKLNRNNVVEWACKAGSVKCAEETRKSLIEHFNGSKKISRELRNIIFCAGLRTANVTIWNKVFDVYLETNNEMERDDLLTALACSQDPHIVKTYLAKIVDPNFKARMDEDPETAKEIIWSVALDHATNINILLDYVTENLAVLNQTGPSWYSAYLWPIAHGISTNAQIEKLKLIFDGISTDTNHSIHRDKHKLLSTARVSLKEAEEFDPRILSFLQSQVM